MAGETHIMNIIHVIPYFPPATRFGGAPEAVFALVKAQAELGHKIAVITGDTGLQKQTNRPGIDIEWHEHSWLRATGTIGSNIKVYYFKNRIPILAYRLKWFTIPFRYALENMEENQSADVLHLHEANIWGYRNAAEFGFEHNIPVIISPHGSLAPPVHHGWKKATHRLLDPIIRHGWFHRLSGYISLCQTETGQYQTCGIPYENITVIPYGCPVFEKEAQPLPFDVPKSSIPLLLCLGRISEAKGIRLALESFCLLWKRHKQLRLVFCGHNEGGVKIIRRFARKNRIPVQYNSLSAQPGISIIPSVLRPCLPNLFRQTDVTICPSPYESFGLVPVESLLCGTPTLVTSAYGCLEHLNTDESMLRVAGHNDPASFSNAIEELLLIEKQGEVESNSILSSWTTIAQRTIDLYTSSSNSQ